MGKKTLLSKKLSLDEIISLNREFRKCYRNKKLFKQIPNSGIGYVISDLHGNVRALECVLNTINFEQRINNNENIHLIFLGDYVDKGSYNLLTMYFIFKLKMKYPKNITLLKGNHESNWAFNKFMSFKREIKQLYTKEEQKIIFREFNKTFSVLPVIATCENGLVAMHGGPPKSLNLYGITQLGLQQILWSDIKQKIRKSGNRSWWRIGIGYKFSVEDVGKFLTNLNKTFLLRGHSHTTKGVAVISHNIMTVISANSLSRFGGPSVLQAQAAIVEVNLEKELNHVSQVKTIFITKDCQFLSQP